MPLTFIDIERQKNWRIWVFFLFLLFLYVAIAVVFFAAFLPLSLHAARFWIFAIAAAALIAGIHFWFSAYDMVHTVIQSLNAQPPDPQDDIHKMLMNIMQEIHVVTGRRRTIQCVVIPSFSMNALAAADLKGEAVIGITEGLLSRLTRPQIETVLAHEAHHILSGDCLEATVAASLFGTFSAVMEKSSRASGGRSFASPAILLAWVLLKLSYMLNMFISREREYRADAASVRMTRNPVALAETLHQLSRSWRGAGFIGSGFEMLCIVNPEISALDEAEGLWSDLFSTHPPIRTRMDVLLKMARVSISELDAKADKRKAAESTQRPPEPKYYAMDPQQQWQGPFIMAELSTLPWLSPLSWITTGDQEPVDRAWTQPLINAIFSARLSQKEQAVSSFTCPTCRQPLVTTAYESTRVYRCNFCAGTLVENDKIPRIIVRTQQPCTERLAALAKAVVDENQLKLSKKMLAGGGKSSIPLYPCPKCNNPMTRSFYNSVYLIEVDRCGFCGLTWFDQDELEMLQCLIEHRIVPEVKRPAGPINPLSSGIR
jgi:heat shock protein HtpX